MGAARPFPAAVDRQVTLGAACWVLTVVFFVGQAVAQAASTVPYSLTRNYISELGITTCGTFTQGAYSAPVCSPLHTVMNATFVVSGLLTLLGAVLTRRAWPARRLTVAGLTLLVLAGAGQVLVGFRPANVDIALHGLGALFGIAGADLALLLLGFAVWRSARRLAVFSLVLGAVGLVSFFLFGNAASLGLVGLLERFAGYPLVVWMIVVGASLLLRRYSRMRGSGGVEGAKSPAAARSCSSGSDAPSR